MLITQGAPSHPLGLAFFVTRLMGQCRSLRKISRPAILAFHLRHMHDLGFIPRDELLETENLRC